MSGTGALGLKTTIVVLLQSLALLGMIGAKQWTLNTGTSVILETRPIDPRSLFRGDYVRLQYAINTLDLDALKHDDHFSRGETAYVVLERGKPYWKPVAVHHTPPALLANEVAIKGEVRNVQTRRWNRETNRLEPVRYLDMHYGIESYFVPEGEGRRLEHPAEGEKVDIRIAVDRFGNAGIKGVLVNGQERYTETLL